MSYFVFEVLEACLENIVMGVGQARHLMYLKPFRVRRCEAGAERVIIGIDQGEIGQRDNTFAGIAGNFPESVQLFKKDIGYARQRGQQAIGSSVNAFVVPYPSTWQCPATLADALRMFDQKDIQFTVAETK